MTDITDRQIVERNVTFNRWGPLMGVAFVVFTVASIIIGNTPDPDASGTKVIEFYTKHQGVVVTSVAADVVGAIFGLLFFGYLYAWLRRHDRGWLPNVWLIASAVMAVAALIGGGSEFMLVDQVKHLTPDTAKALNVVSTELFDPIGAAAVGAALVALAVSIWTHRSASRGYAIVGVIIAIASVALFFTPLGLFGFILWILVFSVRLLMRRESVAPSGAQGTA